MKLKNLKIDEFKNLNNFELDFTDKDGITILIGNNGSGKSNVLEAISAIFTGLYKLKSSARQPSFKYEIEYILRDKNIKISNQEYIFEVDGNVLSKTEFRGNEQEYLPYNIIASYSGEETRLWDRYYSYLHADFKRDINSETTRIIPANKLLDVHGVYWNEALLALLLSGAEDSKKFIQDQLKIETIDTVFFDFNIPKINKKKGEVGTNILLGFLDILNPNSNLSITKTLEEIKDLFSDDYERDIFIKLTSCSNIGYIQNIKIQFNSFLNTEDLSEGQKKQILIKSMLDFIANEHSLILLDEPDSHIHVINKVHLKDLLYLYKDSRDTILTTHSPSLTHAFDSKHITMIVDGKIEDKTKQEIFSHVSDGIWNYQEQSIFLSSTKDMVLLVEGKHDKSHINEAFKRFKSDYSDLEFDIFYADGANNLKQLVLGFSTTDFDFESKKIIAIFDDDDDGRKGRSQQNFKKVTDDIYSLKSNDDFYGILLPKRDDFSGECTIENMYEASKFKEAMNNVLLNRSANNNFFNTGINDISKKIREDAKNYLMHKNHEFEDEDFNHFKKLFDLIKEIKRL